MTQYFDFLQRTLCSAGLLPVLQRLLCLCMASLLKRRSHDDRPAAHRERRDVRHDGRRRRARGRLGAPRHHRRLRGQRLGLADALAEVQRHLHGTLSFCTPPADCFGHRNCGREMATGIGQQECVRPFFTLLDTCRRASKQATPGRRRACTIERRMSKEGCRGKRV